MVVIWTFISLKNQTSMQQSEMYGKQINNSFHQVVIIYLHQ